MSAEEQQQIFNNWIADHRGLLFKVVRAYASDAMDRDDLFQEIVIQVWRSVISFRGDSSVTTWLYRIALNVAIKWKRNESRRPANQELDRLVLVVSEASEPDPRLEWLQLQISALDKVDRSIALLLLDGFTYKEIANIAGVTETNVGVKINRIKQHLIKASKSFNHGI